MIAPWPLKAQGIFTPKSLQNCFVLVQWVTRNTKTFISTSNCRNAIKTYLLMSSQNIINFDHTDWEITVFEVKQMVHFLPYIWWISTLGVKFLHYTRSKSFTIVLGIMLVPYTPIFKGREEVWHIQNNFARSGGLEISNSQFIFLWAEYVLE